MSSLKRIFSSTPLKKNKSLLPVHSPKAFKPLLNATNKIKIVLAICCLTSAGQLLHANESQNQEKTEGYNPVLIQIAYVDSLNNEASELIKSGDYSVAEAIIQNSIQIARSCGYMAGVATGLNELGVVNEKYGNYDLAELYYYECIRIWVDQKNRTGIADELNNIGVLSANRTNYADAVNYYLLALSLRKQEKDSLGIGISYMSIGNVYFMNKSYDKALAAYNTAVPFFEKLNAQWSLAIVWSNLGLTYLKKEQLDLAKLYNHKSLIIEKSIGDHTGEAYSMNILGEIYKKQEDYDSALYYVNRANEVFEEAGFMKELCETYGNLGSISNSAHLYDQAVKYYSEQIKLADDLGISKRENLAFLGLSNAYKHLGNTDSALVYLEKYVQINEEISAQKTAENIAEIEEKYENEKKQEKINSLLKDAEIQDLEILRKRNETYILILLFFTLSLLAGWIIFTQRVRSQKIKQQLLVKQQLMQSRIDQERLEKKNLELEMEKHEQKLKSYAQQLMQNTDLLEKLKLELEDYRARQNDNTIDPAELIGRLSENLNPESFWEEFMSSFNLVYKEFLDTLNSRFSDLTRNEVRLCILFKCNLGNKEIANILHISSDSVKKAVNRLRKKLAVPDDVRLKQFIEQLN